MRIVQNIEDLRMAVQGIVVKDYGDFKRKTITYLNRYVENQGKLTEEQEKQVNFMKWYIQFHPNLELNSTKLWTLQQLEKLATH
ncbi:MAG: hypothetical protein HRT44_10485 [Bdellovibrionales bacterium]|nr:hypothetical protein [Bdellovibrionales bacterium]NQZ19667.1 hypothetical protein [Bdellovibrionales bacterium]